MTSSSQFALNVRFDPKTQGKHGSGRTIDGTKADSNFVSKRNFNTEIPEAPEV